MIMSSLIPNYKQIVHFCKEIGDLYLIEEFNLDRQHNYQLLLVAITIFAWQAISNLAREFSF